MRLESTRVLFATGFRGNHATDAIEAPVAAALAARGAEVHVLRCDEALPACHHLSASTVESGAIVDDEAMRRICRSCCGGAEESFGAFGAAVHHLSSYLAASDVADAKHVSATTERAAIRAIRRNGVPVGEYALAAAVQFFGRPALGHAMLDEEPEGEAVLRRYLTAALLLEAGARRFLQQERFDVVVAQHGFDLPQGLLDQVCRQRGLRSVSWWTKFRSDCVIFGHRGFVGMLATEPGQVWDEAPWTPEMERRLLGFLGTRWPGAGDWSATPRQREGELRARSGECLPGVNRSRRWVGLVPNLMWEIVSDDPSIVFPTVREWVFTTIDFISTRLDLQLIIRLHPHQPAIGRLAAALIAAEFPTLPDNVTVIPAESPLNTYTVMEQCDAVAVWGSTTGLELAARGVPVIVAGPAWVRGKGFTADPRTNQEYLELLGGPSLGDWVNALAIERARRCAYHFYFRHMLPMDLIGRWPAARESGTLATLLDDCQPGRHRSLDVICDGILGGTPFLYPDNARE